MHYDREIVIHTTNGYFFILAVYPFFFILFIEDYRKNWGPDFDRDWTIKAKGVLLSQRVT